jgi:hypothetical protein
MVMNWMGIISAHVMWKQRLVSLLAGRSEEQLDPLTIALDNQCALGKWIYGDGQMMAKLPAFEEVRSMHAQFHRMAAEVVKLHMMGNSSAAEVLLNGEYSKLSERLKHRILGLSQQVNAASDGVPRF